MLNAEDGCRIWKICGFCDITCNITSCCCAALQILYKVLKSERVPERNKMRLKLKEPGYLGLVCFLEDVPVTMTIIRCLYEQVLATGEVLNGIRTHDVVNMFTKS